MNQQTHCRVYIKRNQIIKDRHPHGLAPLSITDILIHTPKCVDSQIKRMWCIEIRECHTAFAKGYTLTLVTAWLEL